jgi:hypothetical protein
MSPTRAAPTLDSCVCSGPQVRPTSASSADIVSAHAWERPLGIAHSPPALSWLCPHACEGERPADMDMTNRAQGQAGGSHKNPQAPSPADQPEPLPIVPPQVPPQVRGACVGRSVRGCLSRAPSGRNASSAFGRAASPRRTSALVFSSRSLCLVSEARHADYSQCVSAVSHWWWLSWRRRRYSAEDLFGILAPSALVIGLLQCLDVNLVHLEHRLHDSLGFLGVLVLHQLAQCRRDDLP